MDILVEWGVDHIYGMPGDSINSLIEPLRKMQDKIKFIQVRHEEAGALAAASYAKLNWQAWSLYSYCWTRCHSFIERAI
jgi:pyruvate oxidase